MRQAKATPLKHQISWPTDRSLPRKRMGLIPVSLLSQFVSTLTCHHGLHPLYCCSCLSPSDQSRSPRPRLSAYHRLFTQIPEDRPYPALLFRTIPSETTPNGPRSFIRWAVVDQPDGAGELVQTVVSTDNATLYLALPHPTLLAVYLLEPRKRVYLIDLATLGCEGLEARQNFNPSQLRAQYEDQREKKEPTLDIGRLPSLRGLLESPAVSKVLFDCRDVASVLKERWGVWLMGGVWDVQLMELTERQGRTPVNYHLRDVKCVEARDLRTCLE